MKCPECQTELPEAAKFCNECGSKIETGCPQCGNLNPPGSKFCLECGHDLSTPPSAAVPKDLSFNEKLAKIQKYLPSGLTEKILSQRGGIEGERKQVTVMFCDMVGFTAVVEKLGPEDAYSMMDRVYEILIHKVHDYEGTVNELTGDGIMALFGAPIALEDAPQRAIRSALAIHREMTRFSDKIKGEKEVPRVRMRIGIHTGPVVVGALGNDLRVEFKAVGDTVNLASRVEGLAEPGTAYVTEDTFGLAEGYFRFEALGEKEVKGKSGPINVYRVIAPSSRRTRFDVSAERGLTRFVGRDRELEVLLDGFERAKAGRGQAFSIVAEAGVGKSRLLYEFRKAVANEDVAFLEGKCLSYSRGVAYHPVTDIFKSSFDIREEDGDSEIREKVKKGLETLGVDESVTLPYLLEILSVKKSGIDDIQMSPEGKKDRIIKAINRISMKGSEIRPLVLAFEDLHWMDKSSEEVSKCLLESIPGARVLLMFTYRPEFAHTWGHRSYHNQITLNRLSNRESLAMAAHLLGTEDIETNLEDLILEKTEGVPFFIEEFIRSLKDLNIIEKKGANYNLVADREQTPIPSTIQDVIMARVDSLPEGPKEVLQAGSVIEREFSHELIRPVTGLPEQELLSRLSILKDSELLYERGIYPGCAYVFKHALTREVVYDSILTNKKKKLHLVIGNAIEELFKGSIDEHYAVLAEHHMTGENWEKAAEYSRLAGKKAVKTASITDAIAHGKKTVASLEELPQTDDLEKRIIDARTVLGLLCLQMNYHIEAKQAVDPIVDPAVKHDYRRRLSQIFTITGAHKYVVEEDFRQAFNHLEEALRISKQEGDIVSLLFVNLWLGLALFAACEFEKASYSLEQSLKISVAANNLGGVSIFKSILSFFVYYLRGDVDLAYETSHESMAIAEQSGDLYSRCTASVARGISSHGKGFLEDAVGHLSKGVDLSETGAIYFWNTLAQFHLGEIYFEMAEYEKSRDHYDKTIELYEQHGILPSWRNLNRIGSSMARVMIDDEDVDVESLYVYVSKNKMPVWEGRMRKHLGMVLLNIDDRHMSEAQDCIEQAIEADERNGMRFHLARDHDLYADLFKRKGDSTGAKENLVKAIEIYKECGADGWVTKAEEELAKLS